MVLLAMHRGITLSYLVYALLGLAPQVGLGLLLILVPWALLRRRAPERPPADEADPLRGLVFDEPGES